jgi:Flp pilus assembly protein TadG
MGESGAALLEFAIVAPMLLLLMLTIIDLGMMLTTQSLLDGAARDAARLIRTGQVYTASSPRTAFQNLLCSEMSSVISTATCQSNVVYEVQVFASYGAVAFTACTQSNNALGAGYCPFASGTGGQIVGVRATYTYSFMIPWVGGCLTGGSCWFGAGTANGSIAGTNTVPLISTVIIQNEPFPS